MRNPFGVSESLAIDRKTYLIYAWYSFNDIISFCSLDYLTLQYYYIPYLNRWIQPDTILPNPTNPQSYNRYTYVYNNPIRYNDPTGHYVPAEVCAMGGANIPHCNSKTGSYFYTGLNSDLESTDWEDRYGGPLAKKTYDLISRNYYIWGREGSEEIEKGLGEYPPPLFDISKWNGFREIVTAFKLGSQPIMCPDLYILGLDSLGISCMSSKHLRQNRHFTKRVFSAPIYTGVYTLSRMA